MSPQSAAAPKMTAPALPMTTPFYCRILFHLKNVDVCKKLELNLLRFDRDKMVLSKKKYFQKSSFFRPVNEKRRKSAGFKDFSEIFFYMVSYYPLILYVV